MNIKQHKFITEYLRTGNKLVAYNNAYPSDTRNGRTTESAANRLMQNPEIAKVIADAHETAMYQAEEALKDQMKEELLTVYQKRLLNKRVVLGEAREEVVFKGKGCAHCSYYREIPYSVRLRYSKDDSLLAGHYPDKRAKKHNPPIETCNIPQQPNEESSTSQLENHNERVISQQNIPPLKEVPDSRRAEDVHSSQSENTKNCNKLQQNTECPPPAGVAKNELGVGHSQRTNQTQENRKQPNEVSSTSQLENHNERVISQHIPPLKEVPDSRRVEDVHSQRTNQTQENHNKTQQLNEVSSTSQLENHNERIISQQKHLRLISTTTQNHIKAKEAQPVPAD